MASKKLALLFGVLCLFLSYAQAQVGASYDIRDSSLIPTRRLAQHNEFLNNAYPFPAKPRNEWEIGVKGGYTYGFTDVHNWGPTGGLVYMFARRWAICSPFGSNMTGSGCVD